MVNKVSNWDPTYSPQKTKHFSANNNKCLTNNWESSSREVARRKWKKRKHQVIHYLSKIPKPHNYFTDKKKNDECFRRIEGLYCFVASLLFNLLHFKSPGKFVSFYSSLTIYLSFYSSIWPLFIWLFLILSETSGKIESLNCTRFCVLGSDWVCVEFVRQTS